MDPGFVPQSWADQMEDDDSHYLPPDTERMDGNTKIVTHYEMIEGKKTRFVRYYKIHKIKVPRSIAERKSWRKFGKASNDPPGPNPSNTNICDEVQMDFPREKENQLNSAMNQQDPQKMKGLVKCRYCDMDHWSTSCPYKDKLAVKNPEKDMGSAPGGAVGGGCYRLKVRASFFEGWARRGTRKGRDDVRTQIWEG